MAKTARSTRDVHLVLQGADHQLLRRAAAILDRPMRHFAIAATLEKARRVLARDQDREAVRSPSVEPEGTNVAEVAETS